jgi:hypothetical protein
MLESDVMVFLLNKNFLTWRKVVSRELPKKSCLSVNSPQRGYGPGKLPEIPFHGMLNPMAPIIVWESRMGLRNSRLHMT